MGLLTSNINDVEGVPCVPAWGYAVRYGPVEIVPDFLSSFPPVRVSMLLSTPALEMSRHFQYEVTGPWDRHLRMRVKENVGSYLPFGRYEFTDEPPTFPAAGFVCAHLLYPPDTGVVPIVGGAPYGFDVALDCPIPPVPPESMPTFDCAANQPENCSLPFVFCDSIDFNNDGSYPDQTDLLTFIDVFGGETCPEPYTCNDLDFNNDGVSPDSADLNAFLSVFQGGPCIWSP